MPTGVLRVGFAAETESLVSNAQVKLQDKRLDLIAANDVTEEGSGFEVETNKVTLIDRSGRRSRSFPSWTSTMSAIGYWTAPSS